MWRLLFSRLLSRLLNSLHRLQRWIDEQDDQYCRNPTVNSLQYCSDLWSHQLQQDIIDNILERLGALDRIHFGAVCKCWRAAVGRSTSTSALDFPLVLHVACTYLPTDRHSMLSLDDNRYYHLNQFYTDGGKLIGMIEGRWMILRHKCNIGLRRRQVISFSILNPLTGKEFMLPPLKDDNINLLRTMVASSDPTTSNCMVAGAGSSLAFCRLTDPTWTFLDVGDEFKDVEFYRMNFLDGKLYVSGDKVMSLIIAFDLRQENRNGVYKPHKIVMTVPSPISYRSSELLRQERSLYSFYLSFTSVATDLVSGELLLIICDTKLRSKNIFGRKNFEEAKKVEVVSFSLYKMNIADDENQWIQVKNLSGRIMFYGNYGGFCMPSKVFGESTQDNCIYYAIRINDDCCDIGKFCLNDQTIVRYSTKRKNACGWFVATTI